MLGRFARGVKFKVSMGFDLCLILKVERQKTTTPGTQILIYKRRKYIEQTQQRHIATSTIQT
jgi:hypothetical protein